MARIRSRGRALVGRIPSRRHAPAARSLVLAGLLAPSAAHAAAEGWAGFAWELGNLLLLVGILVYVSRKPVLSYLSERRAGVQEDLATSQRLLSQAESKLAEFSERSDRLDAEVDQIKQLARRRAEQERERILASARASAERIRNDATLAVERELQRAREELRVEAAELAVELAAQRLRGEVSDADRDRLVDEFVSRVQSGTGGTH